VSLWKEREAGSSLGLFRDFETVQGEKLLEKFPMLKRESGDLFSFHLTRMLPPSQANISPLTANKFSTTRGEELPPSSGANKGTSQGTIAWDFFLPSFPLASLFFLGNIGPEQWEIDRKRPNNGQRVGGWRLKAPSKK
jgi:hypothetical protein